MTKTEEKLPAKEYRGKLLEVADFGDHVFAITIELTDAEKLHVGPFQFERPIGLYVGQQVAVWISGDRGEKGIFGARMRWTNPVPIARGGGVGKKKARKGPGTKGRKGGGTSRKSGRKRGGPKGRKGGDEHGQRKPQHGKPGSDQS